MESTQALEVLRNVQHALALEARVALSQREAFCRAAAIAIRAGGFNQDTGTFTISTAECWAQAESLWDSKPRSM